MYFKVLFFSFGLIRSIDFAAIKKPIALNWFNKINVNTKNRSRKPIHCPTLFKLLFSDKLLSISILHLAVNSRIKYPDGQKIIIYPRKIDSAFCKIRLFVILRIVKAKIRR